jgi:hypothetical protein
MQQPDLCQVFYPYFELYNWDKAYFMWKLTWWHTSFMKPFILISYSYKSRILVQGLLYMVSRIFQFDLSMVFYQYLDLHSSNLGYSSSI